MDDSPQPTDHGDDNGMEITHRPDETGLAPWQKVVAVIGLVVVLAIAIGLLVGGGHTPPVQHG